MTIKLTKGILIAIEGIDGAGKTTQATQVQQRLEAVGLEVIRTKEPTSGEWGQKLRESAANGRLSPEDEVHAFIEDRREHVANVLKPALDEGKITIVDRYYFSTAAYQGARGLDPDELIAQNEDFALIPDVLILLDIEPIIGISRIRKRDGRENLFEIEEELNKVAEVFRKTKRDFAVRLDGTQPKETLTQQICSLLYRGILFKSLCLKKDYKSECEPEYCTPRINDTCNYIKIGQLDPAPLSEMLLETVMQRSSSQRVVGSDS